MTIISYYEADSSAALAKRFATIARGLFDHPASAKDEGVPLENLYRLLEMFRYDSFADESRRGVLALEAPEVDPALPIDESAWHTSIESALQRALAQTFVGTQKEAAIDQLQASIRGLVTGAPVAPADADHAKGFLATFEALV